MQAYKIAHILQEKTPVIWDIIEWLNDILFVYKYGKMPQLASDGHNIRHVTLEDVPALMRFFSEQPADTFLYFGPHPFNASTLRKLIRRKSFWMYIATDEHDTITGYGFVRCFFNGKGFLGKFVDYRHRNKGIATDMIRYGMAMCTTRGIRMFESININNGASVRSSQKACHAIISRRMDDNVIIIEDRPHTEPRGNLFELLRVALGKQSKMSHQLTRQEWQALYTEAQRQWMVGILMDGIERLPERQRPQGDVLYDWIGQTIYIENANKHIREVYDATFGSETASPLQDMPHCILKGLSVATYYHNPLRRQCSDIDLWVGGKRQNVIQRARQIFDTTETPNAFHISTESYHGIPVEVHWRPTIMHNPWLNRRLQRWYRQQDISTAGTDPSFNAVYLMHHAFNHLLTEGIGFRQLIDIYWVFTALSGNMDRVRTDLKAIGLTRFASAVGYILTAYMGMDSSLLPVPPNDKDGELLLEEMLLAGNLGLEQEKTNGLGMLRRRMMTVVRFCHLSPLEVLCIPIVSTISAFKRRTSK